MAQEEHVCGSDLCNLESRFIYYTVCTGCLAVYVGHAVRSYEGPAVAEHAVTKLEDIAEVCRSGWFG